MNNELFPDLEKFCYKYFIPGITRVLEGEFNENKLRFYYRNTDKIMIYLKHNVKPDKNAKNLYFDLDYYRKKILIKLKPGIYDQLPSKPKGIEDRLQLQ